MVQEQPANVPELLAAGEEALFGGAWERARALFAAALEVAETPEGLEGLGAAAFFLDDAVASLDSRERAFRLYWARDDRLGAARVAIALATDHYYHRGDRAVCNGWVQRAHRMLDGLDLSLEHGLLAWWEGHLALKADRDAEGPAGGALEPSRSPARLARPTWSSWRSPWKGWRC
jgi:hypothetical protein